MGLTTGKTKTVEYAMDLIAVADDLDRGLSDLLKAADGDAAADMADDNLYQTAHKLIEQVTATDSPTLKDSFAIRAHRALESAMKKDFSRIAGDAVRKRIMPEHEKIQRIIQRLRDITGKLAG